MQQQISYIVLTMQKSSQENLNTPSFSQFNSRFTSELQEIENATSDYHLNKFYNERLGLSKKFRSHLKKMKITKTSQKCSICQQFFKKDEIVLQLPCKHIFHKENCIKEWLKISCKCPLCNLNLEEYFTSKEQNKQDKIAIRQNKKHERKLQIRNLIRDFEFKKNHYEQQREQEIPTDCLLQAN